MMKKIFIILSFCIISFALSACGQTPPVTIGSSYIMVSLGVMPSGEVVQKFDFAVDSDFLEENGVNGEALEGVKLKLIENFDTFRQEFAVGFGLIYENADGEKEDFAIGKKLKISQTTYDKDLDTITFNIVFEDNATWSFYHPSKEEDDKNQSNGIVFVEKIESKGLFPFASEVTLGNGEKTTVAERYTNAYLKAFENNEKKEVITEKYKPDFVYNYATFSSRVGSDADIRFLDSEGLYHHAWVRNAENYQKENQITLFSNVINRGWWYLFWLIIVGVVTAVALIIAKVISKKKKA